ncbi:MAG: hypothetical protein RL757_2121 [Bacteroidota bacterium]|jgi:cytochrome c oxidase subunit 3
MSNLTVNRRNKIHPQKLALWIACGSITMMFAAWSSAYIVREGQGNWANYRMPDIFYVSTALLVLSSVTLHMCFISFRKGQERAYKFLLILSFLLGISFIALQYLGWNELKNIGLPLGTNASGDFFILISGFHAAHILGGIAAIVLAMVHAFALPFKVTQKRLHRLDLTLNYWHFVDFLWIYLFVFFLSK